MADKICLFDYKSEDVNALRRYFERDVYCPFFSYFDYAPQTVKASTNVLIFDAEDDGELPLLNEFAQKIVRIYDDSEGESLVIILRSYKPLWLEKPYSSRTIIKDASIGGYGMLTRQMLGYVRNEYTVPGDVFKERVYELRFSTCFVFLFFNTVVESFNHDNLAALERAFSALMPFKRNGRNLMFQLRDELRDLVRWGVIIDQKGLHKNTTM